MTIRFFPEGQGDSCEYHNSDNALTFTTSRWNQTSQCFNFAELFVSNGTKGLSSLSTAAGLVDWQLYNADSFDAKVNYSRILYHQHTANAQDEQNQPGHNADRQVTFFSGTGCLDNSPNGVQPWYANSCWSEDQGSCDTLPYGIASFSVRGIPDKEQKDGKCFKGGKYGGNQSAGAHVRASLQAVTCAVVGASIALWLTL